MGPLSCPVLSMGGDLMECVDCVVYVELDERLCFIHHGFSRQHSGGNCDVFGANEMFTIHGLFCHRY